MIVSKHSRRWDLSKTSPACRFYLANDSVTGTQSQGIASDNSKTNKHTSTDLSLCAISNRGLDGGGLYLEAGRPYHGYLFARAATTDHLPASLVVELFDQRASSRISLDMQVLHVNSTSWIRLNFTLTPHTSTECVTKTASTSHTCHANAMTTSFCFLEVIQR